MMVFRKNLKEILVLALAVAALVAVILVVNTTSVSPYANMTDQQAEAQFARYLDLQVAACQKAGGVWQVGFSQASCSAPFQPPALPSWYRGPIPNPAYGAWQILQDLLVLAGCFAGCSVLAAGGDLVVKLVGLRAARTP